MRNQSSKTCPHCSGRLHRWHDVARCAAVVRARLAFTFRVGVVRGVGKSGDWLTGKPLAD